MANPGDVAENPVKRDRAVFRETAGSTNGELLRFEHFIDVGGTGPPEHIHPEQEERFEVVRGRMGVRLDGRPVVLAEGEQLAVAPGTRHTWWNAGPVELHQITEFRPALEFEVFQETLAALAREERTYGGLPMALQFAVLNTECRSNVWVTSPPIPVRLQPLLYRLLAPVARRRGYYARYRRYALH